MKIAAGWNIRVAGGGQAAPPPSNRRLQTNANEAQRAPRVLVVEDEWLIAMEIEAALEEGGLECVGVAISAEEALSMARAHRPQFVLMDIRLKGNGDGIDAALELNRALGIRSLFVSAHVDPSTMERAAAAAPLGWVQKPFSSPQLLQAIESARRILREE